MLGVSVLTPSPNPRPLPELLPLKKDLKLHEEIAKAHPYAFNMGGTMVIPFQYYKEAGKVLMERNMSEVLHDRQTKVVFLPETHLPKMPRVVDIEAFEAKKNNLTESTCQDLGFPKGTPEIMHVKGEKPEKDLSEALKKFFVDSPDKDVVRDVFVKKKFL